MLLTRVYSRLTAWRDDDRGAAMAAVMALLAVSLLLSTLVASSVVTATGVTSSARANVQSQAAAEAGVAAARAGLVAGTCAASGNQYASASGATPRYLATIWVPLGAGWQRGCPANLTTQVRILSTGYASAAGVAGNYAHDTSHLEVVLSSATTPTQINATGPAVYAFSATGFSGGGSLVGVEGSNPAILIKTGDVDCTGGADGDTDIVVANGNLKVAGGCLISGNAWASGSISMPGGPDIGGNAVASAISITGGSEVGGSVWVTNGISMSGGASVGGNATAASIDFANGGTVNGNVQVTGLANFKNSGTVGGNITAGTLTFKSGGLVKGHAWVYGATTLDWGSKIEKNLRTATISQPNYSSGLVGGTTTVASSTANSSPYATNPSAPTAPLVPDWVDFDYDPSEWEGFTVKTITGTTCSYAQVVSAISSAAGSKVLINALGCSRGISISGSDVVTLTADTAIFTNKLSLSGGGGFTASSAKRLWLITPDETDNDQPTCTSGNNSYSISGGFSFSTNLSVMLYTPCDVSLGSSTTFRGQVFSGQAGIAGGATLGYVAVGLPGVDLSTGQETTVSASEIDRAVVSSRNVSVGN